MEQLNEADREIQTITGVLSQTPDDDPKMRQLLTHLAKAHDKRFDLRHEPDDIHKVIEYTSMVLTLTPDKDPGLPDVLTKLGEAYSDRFQRLGSKEDMEKAVEYQSLALGLILDGHPDLPRRLANLAVCYRFRFKHLGEQGDIEKAIKFDTQAVELTSQDDKNFPEWLKNLGTSHSYRFGRFGELNDLQKAIEYQSRALALTPDGHPGLSNRLGSLAMSHKDRFERLGELSDLEQAIEYGSRAQKLTPDDHPHLPIHLTNLAVCHSDRFERLGNLDDLEQAIEYESHALALTPDDHPEIPIRLSNIALSHKYRFGRLGELCDLEQAIEYGSRALASTPNDHPELSSRLANLAVYHSDRFGRLGELGDLEQAIDFESRALALTPDKHPELSSRLANLAASHKSRFGRLGDLSDLEKAVEYGSRAQALTPDNHPRLPVLLANLAVYHKDRFGHLGELHDLEQAIEYESRALALVPNDHPELSSHLANIAVSHTHQFQRLGELRDLNQAIEYETRALDSTPNDHPDLLNRLSNLAVSHKDRFKCLGEPSDLEQAIKYESRALDLTPDNHPHSSYRLVNLAASYRSRFGCLGELQDIEKAIQYESRALAAIDSDHPNFPQWNFNHALTHIHCFVHSNDATHLQATLSCFRTASMSLAGAPRDRFRIAHNWATLASINGALHPTEAYQATLDLLPQFIWLGATVDQRYEDIKTVQTLAVDAALAAIISSNYSLALEWLEHARCIVWSQSLMLRSPLDQLRRSHPALATHLRKVADKLYAVSSDSRESRALSTSTTLEQVAQEHRQLAKEYNTLLSKARALPGFEDFLQPLKMHHLVNATRSQPIIVINCHEDRCDALVILPQQLVVNHIPLPNFNGRRAQSACSELRISLDDTIQRERGTERRPQVDADQEPGFESVLASLWYDVVKPILAYLGYTKIIPQGNLPHITWCPTGAMTFLPLHAAGDYDQPQSRVFDYVISSYTPTLTALLESTPCSLSRESRVLAIGQAATRGHTELPGTALELARLKDCTEDKAAYTQLVDEAATTSTVLSEMEQHDWVHLACHAHQNVGNATESGFFLHDGVLDLASINRRSFKGKGLAYLSACQTATGDQELPDEAVHLASGMLMAGYTSVIATMWSVHDEDAPGVASAVYSQLMMEGRLGNGEAGRALHHAVAELRDRIGENQFVRWVPFIHIGS
ncbi:unnamed protein product [Rhizoctonia solani]|uniref:CHAT domain-containing protein n=1 Tax=Rhizoctonia solani TaxID=456999 RepID=A0A8H3GKS2_9AGAM|nr:unnamed protein product [Rhizoctonia solani]